MLARYDDPDAETALRLAALSAPRLPGTRLFYGAYLSREGLLDLALHELHGARDVDPTDARVHREIGVVHLLGGDAHSALGALASALGETDEDGEIRLLYALALLRAGEDVAAAEELHRAAAELTGEADVQLFSALPSAAEG